MKVKMKFLIVIIFVGFFSLNASTTRRDVVPEGLRNDYHFEIYNKSKTSINLALVSESEQSPLLGLNQYGVVLLESSKKLRLLGFNPQISYRVIIKQSKTDRTSKFFTFKILPNERRKNIFLTWDDQDIKRPFLRPQTGPLKGLLRKTESGLPLSGNIKQTEINLTGIGEQ